MDLFDLTGRVAGGNGGIGLRIAQALAGQGCHVCGIAVYLMSKASSYHTADTFVIDGGYTAF